MFERSSRTVSSSDGVDVVVYDEPADPSPSRSTTAPILFSHATGFHGRVFAPVAALLGSRWRTTFDYRGHGDTPAPPEAGPKWEGFGDDALAVARDTARRLDGRPLLGIGHSMGGAGLVMAALREPRLFAALVLFEPIIFPPEVRDGGTEGDNPLAAATRRRRRTFASHAEALANFAAKPPLSSLAPDALEAYVRHGFSPHPDGVHVKCDPEFEARTYEMGTLHDTWSRLGEMMVPTYVMTGVFAPRTPAAIAPLVHERLPRSTLVEWADLGHFGPLEAPGRFATFVADLTPGITGS